MKQLPTAEEFIMETYSSIPFELDQITELMQEFAKLHVQAALQSAAENGNIKITDVYSNDTTLVRNTSVRYNSLGIGDVYPEECTRHTVSLDGDSILNAYPLDKIK